MNFEDYIRKRREEFDHLEKIPMQEMWIGIDESMRKRTLRRRIRIGLAAAAAIAAIVFIPMFIPQQAESNPVQFNYNDEFVQKELEYYQLSSDKKESMGFSELDPKTYSEILGELNQLDSMYSDMKSDLMNRPDIDAALETAIRFHERRLKILELLEKEIENQKRFEENENELKI